METSYLLIGGALVIGAVVGYVVRQVLVSQQAASIEQRTKHQLEESKTKAKTLVLEAQERSAQILEEIKKEERERKSQLDKVEQRLMKKEELLERETLELKDKEKVVQSNLEKSAAVKGEIEKVREKAVVELERVAGMGVEEAKRALFADIEKRYRDDLTEYTKKIMHDRREEVEKQALEILTTAIQRYSRSSATELTTTVVPLPDEDFKGKVIGKEGRNIRTFERLTGVELVIDETPDTIVISSFDPVRREIARIALERLIKDGRIQPAKIEEKVEADYRGRRSGRVRGWHLRSSQGNRPAFGAAELSHQLRPECIAALG